ncbi:MAG: cell division protein ZapA [Crocinitomicaceae bacterium]|jgi:cell division protein ZapA (FtsZ GTPase activity inhibitor)|nr:cell division protein ZapA [Crocinitomicaceae bacterium]
MEKVSLKIVIAGRTYPLTIKGEEENAIREAAERINTNIQKLQGTYAVKDMQDLLAMTALQMAVQLKNTAESAPAIQPQFDEDIQKIIYKIDAQLQ